MTIPDLSQRSKAIFGHFTGGNSGLPGHILIVSILVLSATASFALGYLAGRDTATGKGSGIWIENMENMASSTSNLGGPAAVEAAAPGPAPITEASLTKQSSGAYVASRTGKKYYLTTCASAKRISDANKVFFATKADAEAKGYTPASNCPGL